MGENREIKELTEIMGDREGLESDFSYMMTGIQDLLQRKYLNKVHAAISTEKKLAARRPPREAALLEALKAYAPPESAAQFDRMIRLSMTMNTMRHMNQELQNTGAAKGQLSARDDGEDTAPSVNPAMRMLLTFALLQDI